MSKEIFLKSQPLKKYSNFISATSQAIKICNYINTVHRILQRHLPEQLLFFQKPELKEIQIHKIEVPIIYSFTAFTSLI